MTLLEGELPKIKEIPDPAVRPTIPVLEAFALLGTSHVTGYEQIRQGTFPVPVLRLGRSMKVPTAALLDLLHLRPGPVAEPESGDQATSHALRRLLERRPDLRPPAALPGLPVLIPEEEDPAYSLDRLELMAWVARQVDQAVEVDVGACLRAGCSWRLLAKALRLSEDQALGRYGHLAGGSSRQEGDQPP